MELEMPGCLADFFTTKCTRVFTKAAKSCSPLSCISLCSQPLTTTFYPVALPTRKKPDFADFVCDLVESQFPQAEFIQLVMDNLNTHFGGLLLETFGPEKTEQLMKKQRFIYTPKQGS